MIFPRPAQKNRTLSKESVLLISTISGPFTIYKKDSTEKARDASVFVHVDFFRRRGLRQARHGHDVAGEGHNEARPRADAQAPAP